MPRFLGNLVLGDFGSAVRGDEERNHMASPKFYRAPAIMLGVPWSYPVDIWCVGIMVGIPSAVLWCLFLILCQPDMGYFRRQAHVSGRRSRRQRLLYPSTFGRSHWLFGTPTYGPASKRQGPF